MADEINVPSLVLVLVVSGFLIRHFFFRPSPQTSGERGAGGQRRDQRRAEALERRIEVAVDHIQQIFPYADRREIWWDLRLNGINVAATTERILAGRLDVPPITFQPPMPPAQQHASGAAAAAAAAGAGSTTSRPSQPSLIQRYNLESRIAEVPTVDSTLPASAGAAVTNNKTKSWSANRDERESILQKRRNDMILEARRKMAARIASEKEATASGKTKSA